jgi:cysteinyl-tRNA synthetase
MEWNSPWGKGFPGWHTECVAMAAKYLKVPFDIHCGGIDHISIHHTNEIAQAEAAFNKNLANFWLHGEFLVIKKDKMAKSEGNIILLENLLEQDIEPLAYRYLCLTVNYRSKINFSWEALKASQKALNGLRDKIAEAKKEKNSSLSTNQQKKYKEKFLGFINDDLDTPKALALTWQIVKDKKISAKDKIKLIADFDKIFGLDLFKEKEKEIPKEIKKLAEKRETYRKQKNWQKADEIRNQIEKMGYTIKDTEKYPEIKKI